ncbi:MAG: alpha/beta fold hydrolase [Tepidisphaera sp.]
MRNTLVASLVVLACLPAMAQPAPAAAGTPETTLSGPLSRRAGPLGIRFDQAAPELRVVEAVAGSVAATGGVRPGDIVLSVGGSRVSTREELASAMRTRRGGEVVGVTVRRDDAEVELSLSLTQASERIEGSTVEYGSVAVPAGYRLRTIVTRPEKSPLARDGRHPAFLYVQGIICQSIDRPNIPEAADTRIVHEFAKAGFVTLRVDKPGLGDSEGPPCSEIDFQTELQGFSAALRQLAAMPEVDPERIYVFGHSMGGVIAPYLSAEVPVRGTVVYGTLVRTWFEYQLENVRRQAALSPGVSEADVTDAVLAETRQSSTVLVDKKTLGDAWNRWPELRQPAQGTMLDENHIATRGMAFFHQLQDLNLARAWQNSTGAVLAIYGEYDWVTSLHDHEKIASIVNARTPGAGTSIVMPKADHGFTTHETLEASVPRMGQGTWDADLPVRVLEWVARVEGRAEAAPAPGAAEPKPAAARASTPAWTRLNTESYPGKQDDITFVNDRLGWYGNGSGKVFKTADGGDTWAKVWEKPGTFVRCLTFLDENVGVLGNIGPGYFPGVTDPAPIYRTEDGGTTWTAVSNIEGPPVVGLCAVEVVSVPFVNAGNLDRRSRIVGVGRVGGPAAYIWSDDLGKTWKQGKLPEIAAMAFDVHFLDERRGFIASATSADVAVANALILSTDDAGATWKEVYRSSRPYELTWKLSFPTSTVGYCTIQSYNPDTSASRRYVAKTTDGGQSWAEIPLVDDHRVRQFGVAFLDEKVGWVGAMPYGFATTDGGATWTRAEFGNAVNKIRVVRSESGVTVFAIGTQVHRLGLPGVPGR